MTGPIYPRIPHDEVQSEYIQEQIQAGSFENLTHREYVNNLTYVEWYGTDGLSPNTTGLSAAGASHSNWRIATKYPDAYDSIRQEFDAKTRHEYPLKSGSSNDPAIRRPWARRHRNEWNRVCDEPADDETAVAGVPIEDRPRFGTFRFPKLPYDDLTSEFIRVELERGSFDDLEYRQYVNRLVYIEAWTREPRRFASGMYPPSRPWIVAAKQPTEYDIIREELDAPTRSELTPRDSVYYGDIDHQERTKRHKREWQRVQETLHK